MDDIRLEKGNELKAKIERINSKLYSLQKIKEQFNNGNSNIGLSLDFVNVRIFNEMSGTIGVDDKLIEIIIDTTIEHFEQKLNTLEKEYEEL